MAGTYDRAPCFSPPHPRIPPCLPPIALLRFAFLSKFHRVERFNRVGLILFVVTPPPTSRPSLSCRCPSFLRLRPSLPRLRPSPSSLSPSPLAPRPPLPHPRTHRPHNGELCKLPKRCNRYIHQKHMRPRVERLGRNKNYRRPRDTCGNGEGLLGGTKIPAVTGRD